MTRRRSPAAQLFGSGALPADARLGAFSIDQNGVYKLDPTPNAGAALRGATLVITGELADPSG